MKRLFFISVLVMLGSCSHLNKKAFIVIAHRGASGYLPEHTLEAVSLAHSFNIDYIEPDVVLTKDKVPVILHDIHIDTTTNIKKVFPKRHRKDGRYYAIDFYLNELKRLKVNERINLKTEKAYFPNRFPVAHASFEIPTLVEYLELIKGLNKTRKKDIGIYLEIKSPLFHKKHNKDITKIVINLLRTFNYATKNDNFYIQCFDSRTLKRIRNEFKLNIKLTQLIADNSWKESDLDYDQMRSVSGIKAIAKYADGIGPWINHLLIPKKDGYNKSNLVELAHKSGLVVHPYTHRIDSLPSFIDNHQQLLDILINEIKIDGIFSDFSDKVRTF